MLEAAVPLPGAEAWMFHHNRVKRHTVSFYLQSKVCDVQNENWVRNRIENAL